MVMEAYKEITVWEDGNTAINHTYLLQGDMMVAYIRYGTTVPFYFKSPIRISKSKRKFEKLEVDPFIESSLPTVAVIQQADIKEIEGSKGAVYYLNVEDKTCTCPGYTYRGTCKHIKELETV
jgi:hypothetical protein